MMIPFVREHWTRVLAGAVLVVVIFGNQGFRGLVRNWIELKHLRREIAQLERRESFEAERLKAVRSGGVPLERLARRELGYIRKGEIEYRFAPPAEENK